MANLDITWLRDEPLDDDSALPAPGVLAAEIVEEFEAALAQFSELAASLQVQTTEGS
jgi:type I restriction enzyme M protein